MASYAKLVKTCQDFALGIQSVNGARDNLEAFRTAWASEHGTIEPSPRQQIPDDPYLGYGHHTIAQISRVVVKVTPVTAASGQVGFNASFQPAAQVVSRNGTGQYFIAVKPGQSYFWGTAWPSQASSSSVRFCKPVSYYPTGSGSSAGVLVNCYDYDAVGATFALADFEFVCTIYAHDVASSTTLAAGTARPASPPPWSPRARAFDRHGRKGR